MNFRFILSFIGDIITNIRFWLAIPVWSISKGEICMNLFAVSFFGHREVDDPFVIEQQLEAIVRELLHSKEYVEFLVGRDGEFDQLVSSTIRRCKRTIRDDNSSLVLVRFYSKIKPPIFQIYPWILGIKKERLSIPDTGANRRSMYMVVFNFISYNGLALGTSAFCISKVFSTIFRLISWKGIFISKHGPFSAND